MTPRAFFLETLSIFLGDVLAATFLSAVAYGAWRILKYPGFRVGASWGFSGWNFPLKGRWPNSTDTDAMEFTPQLNIVSYNTNVKKVIHSVWVRERADVYNPGVIYGHLDLQKAGVPIEARTTGSDILSLPGPAISEQASEMRMITSLPVFIQTSDGDFYKALSAGNEPEGVVRLRMRFNRVRDKARRGLYGFRDYVREKF